ATIVPFLVAPSLESRRPVPTSEELGQELGDQAAARPERMKTMPVPAVPGAQPIADLQWRKRARVAGRVRSVRVQPLSGVPSLECTLVDASGEALTVVFLGRRSIAGIETGTKMIVEGTVGKHRDRLAMINPVYELLAAGSDSRPA
ncbi:MAG: OB-fold nucleic acid binding domain-containing protein, partial [Acidobacteriota bacterium]|nr:OB-fold nucleic acid binding domain-containing protein [Acidobacteriota bacterium]